MTNTSEPLDVVRADAQRWLTERARKIVWSARNWLGPQLVAVIGNGLVSVSLPFAAAPIVVAGGVAIAFALMAGSKRWTAIPYPRTLRPGARSIDVEIA